MENRVDANTDVKDIISNRCEMIILYYTTWSPQQAGSTDNNNPKNKNIGHVGEGDNEIVLSVEGADSKD